MKVHLRNLSSENIVPGSNQANETFYLNKNH